ncbi:MAG: hypothetical protein OZSIB_3577 [Candidatus Ozemobacter sibiricus]|jgi:hypothetical protein|uniref:Uncharacterized protein n=1 Tax=Candidatus Ozemobacter sibiricus TaxID=2268124 RepID=A0A367ZPN9_9BACT|nr:MAG: hypothetical protein OZSIB_3577 [Candidatus Ozemobacter sibiricus]
MTRIIALFVVVSLCFTLIGCTGSQPQGQTMTPEEKKAKGLTPLDADGRPISESAAAPAPAPTTEPGGATPTETITETPSDASAVPGNAPAAPPADAPTPPAAPAPGGN